MERDRERECKIRAELRRPKAWHQAKARYTDAKKRKNYMLILRDGGMTYREVGEVMGVSASRANQLVHAGAKHAREHREQVLFDMSEQLRLERNYLDLGRPLPKWGEA
jgi:DNA-directed RNA polymerase specialized sigma24 family protein